MFTELFIDFAVSTTTGLIIAVTIVALAFMVRHIRAHIKENKPEPPASTSVMSTSHVMRHDFGNPCERGCAVCN